MLGQLVTNNLITSAEREKRRIASGGYEFDVASTGYEYSIVANPDAQLASAGQLLDEQSGFGQHRSGGAGVGGFGNSVLQEIRPEPIDHVGQYDTRRGDRPLGTRQQGEPVRRRSGHSRQPQEKASVVTAYTFREGSLKGFRVGGTAQHQGKQVTAATTAGGVIYGNSFTRVDAWLGYNLGRVPRFTFISNLDLQLNVYNAG